MGEHNVHCSINLSQVWDGHENRIIDNKNEPGYGQTHDWLLSDEPWQIQGHAMVLFRHFAEQVIPA